MNVFELKVADKWQDLVECVSGSLKGLGRALFPKEFVDRFPEWGSIGSKALRTTAEGRNIGTTRLGAVRGCASTVDCDG